MNIFIKDNWFKVALIFALLVLAYVIYNSPILFKNNQTGGNKNITLVKQCREDGEKYFQKDLEEINSKKYRNGVLNCYYWDPIYIFNSKLNTCLYSGGYSCELESVIKEGIMTGEHPVQWRRHITDVYTNKVLAEVYISDSSSVTDWEQKAIDDYWKESEKFGFEK